MSTKKMKKIRITCRNEIFDESGIVDRMSNE